MPRPKGSKNKPKVDANGKPLKPAKKAPKVTTLGTPKAPVAKAVVEETRAKTVAPVKETLIQKIEEKVKEEVKEVVAAVTSKPQPSFPVNQPALAPETPAAKSTVTKAVAGKNTGEAVIRAVDDEEGTDTGSHVVMQGGKPVLRKNTSNPDLD